MRRFLSPETKVKLILDFIKCRQSVTSFCKEHAIGESSFYSWRSRFIIAGKTAFVRSRVRSTRLEKIDREPRGARDLNAHESASLLSKIHKIMRKEVGGRSRLDGLSKLQIINLIDTVPGQKGALLALANIPRSTFYRWKKHLALDVFSQQIEFISSRVKVADRKEIKEAVFKMLHSPPSSFGFNRTTWRALDLQGALRTSGVTVGRHAIRYIIKKAGYRWFKARKVLTSKDPDYRVKLDHIQNVLQNLKVDEGFFSVDEYGPFSVKCRGGKRLVGPGESATVPQWQKSKGVLIVTAALELSTNQVTHFYSAKKNTDEMIRLLDMLLEQYGHLSRFYLSWDAASWHMSKKLTARIKSNNIMAFVTGSTIVELAPLPAGAQFLNVIEAIFSGMARAIIHNSDYSSLTDAKTAIDAYYYQRNKDFRENPQRAGKTIWGKELQPSIFSETNNSKDPSYR
jgi:transposase-like protein